jgi:glutathione-regulated potassium-efflux system ancillary protein KefG
MTVVSTGGREEAYRTEGANRYSMRQLLAPFEQTVTLCRMQYLPPFVVHGTHLLEESAIRREAERYRQVLTGLRDGFFDPEELLSLNYINDLNTTQTP